MAYVKVGEKVTKFSGGDTQTAGLHVMDDKTGKLWWVPFSGYSDETRRDIGKWKLISDGPNLGRTDNF